MNETLDIEVAVRAPGGYTGRQTVRMLRRPAQLGLNVTPAEYDDWFGMLPRPDFVRVFAKAGAGLPSLTGRAMTLPAGVIPHVSHKDQVPLDELYAWWTEWAQRNPVGELWWTYHHEPEPDIDRIKYHTYWRTLRVCRDSHHASGRITLVNIHTLYASRFKPEIDWRLWLLPGVADVEGWDVYAPTGSLEPAESLLGIPIASAEEFGCRWSIPELGAKPVRSDPGDLARTGWYRRVVRRALDHGAEAIGLWCSGDYRPHSTVLVQGFADMLTERADES